MKKNVMKHRLSFLIICLSAALTASADMLLNNVRISPSSSITGTPCAAQSPVTNTVDYARYAATNITAIYGYGGSNLLISTPNSGGSAGDIQITAGNGGSGSDGDIEITSGTDGYIALTGVSTIDGCQTSIIIRTANAGAAGNITLSTGTNMVGTAGGQINLIAGGGSTTNGGIINIEGAENSPVNIKAGADGSVDILLSRTSSFNVVQSSGGKILSTDNETLNLDLYTHTISNAAFIGNGAGITNLPTSTNSTHLGGIAAAQYVTGDVIRVGADLSALSNLTGSASVDATNALADINGLGLDVTNRWTDGYSSPAWDMASATNYATATNSTHLGGIVASEYVTGDVVRTESDPIYTNALAGGTLLTKAGGAIDSSTSDKSQCIIWDGASSGIWTQRVMSGGMSLNGSLIVTGDALRVETDPIWTNALATGFIVAGPVTNVGSLTVTNSSDVNLNVLSSGGGAYMTFESQSGSDNAQITIKAAASRSAGFDFWEGGTAKWLFSTVPADDDLGYYWKAGSSWVKMWSIDQSGRVTMLGSLDMGGNSITNVDQVVITDALHLTPRATCTTTNEGTIYYDSADDTLKCWDGTTWQNLY